MRDFKYNNNKNEIIKLEFENTATTTSKNAENKFI